MTKKELELAVFNKFLDHHPPLFESEAFCVEQPDDDPPDILCTSRTGRLIGFELKAWLHEEQMGAAKASESTEESMLEALGPLPPNEYQHVGRLWLRPKRPLRTEDAGSFRAELFDLIARVEARWPDELYWHSPQGHRWNDFSDYPTLQKYLDAVEFFPQDGGRSWAGSVHWIRFPNRARAYDERVMLAPLRKVLQETINRYQRGRPGGLDEFNLIVHYDQAFEYNVPVETAQFNFDDAAQKGREYIGEDAKAFDRVFLVNTIPPGEAYLLYSRGDGKS